ncbi:MAG: hypothetical protein AAGC95_08800 [Pseudomonadota bacterium]
MKYVRFQGLELNCGTSSKRGIFQLAYQLKHSPFTAGHDDKELRKNLDWLEMHLQAPSILDGAKNHRAICWFKDAACEPLKRIWSIKFILGEYGVWIDRITTRKPGYIIYEDGWQIVAKPFRKVVRG